MKSHTFALAIAMLTGTGCMMNSLQRHTLALGDSTVELRYHEVMDNLARVANDPSALPCYASIFAGGSSVSDTQQLAATTTWQHVITPKPQNGFASQTANPTAIRQIAQNWTLDPVVVPEKLEAIRACCKWVVHGRNTIDAHEISLLQDPDAAPPGSDRHFGVEQSLAKLPSGWVHTGKFKDVPHCARYKANSGTTWVWVELEGMKGLADFSLILQNIARIDSNSGTLYNLPPTYSPIRFSVAGSPIYEDPNDKTRYVRISAQVTVNPNGELVPETMYTQYRIDNRGTEAHFKSQINLTVPSPR